MADVIGADAALAFGTALVTGSLIGAVGIGGILLAPFLVVILDYGIHSAIAVSSWSFLFTGLAGTLAYGRRGTIDWRAAGWLTAAIVPAGFAGARSNAWVDERVLILLLCALIALSAIRELLASKAGRAGGGRMPSAWILTCLGLGAGFTSAITGTGGPVVLVPLLLLSGAGPLAAIGVSQVAQLPIAVSASAGYLLFGDLDVRVGTALGLAQALGVLAGARFAHAVPARVLRRLVAATMLGTALVLVARML